MIWKGFMLLSRFCLNGEGRKISILRSVSASISHLKIKLFIGLEIFSIVSCSTRDTSPWDFSIMTLLPGRNKWIQWHKNRTGCRENEQLVQCFAQKSFPNWNPQKKAVWSVSIVSSAGNGSGTAAFFASKNAQILVV